MKHARSPPWTYAPVPRVHRRGHLFFSWRERWPGAAHSTWPSEAWMPLPNRSSSSSCFSQDSPHSDACSIGNYIRSPNKDSRSARDGAMKPAWAWLSAGVPPSPAFCLSPSLAASQLFSPRSGPHGDGSLPTQSSSRSRPMVEEVAFRGYGFQRFAQVVGPVGATLGYAAFYRWINCASTGIQQGQPCGFRHVQLAAFNRISADSRPLAQLGL